MLCVEFLNVCIAYLNQRICYSIIRLHYVLRSRALLASIERKLRIQTISFNQTLKKGRIFLLYIRQANRILPIHPVCLSLFQVCGLLWTLSLLLKRRKETNEVIAIEATGLIVESTALSNQLVRMLTNTELTQLVFCDLHADFLALCLQRIIHQHHLPYLITNLGRDLFVEITTTCFNFVHFG